MIIKPQRMRVGPISPCKPFNGPGTHTGATLGHELPMYLEPAIKIIHILMSFIGNNFIASNKLYHRLKTQLDIFKYFFSHVHGLKSHI